MDDKKLNEIITEVLHLPELKKKRYEKSSLVLFAKEEIMNGDINPHLIIAKY